MDPQLLVGILVGLVSLATASAVIARYFAKNQLQFDQLKRELQSLREQNVSIKTNVVQYPSVISANTFQ